MISTRRIINFKIHEISIYKSKWISVDFNGIKSKNNAIGKLTQRWFIDL